MEDIFYAAIAFVGVVIVLGLLMALPVYYLWNWLMPVIFGLTEITFWQAPGISILSRILFKNSSSSSSS